jgi:plasmid stabilization system protein ParE
MNVAVSLTAISAVSSVSTDTFGTGWPAAIEGCHDLLAVALGTNSMEDTFERACHRQTARPHRGPQDPRILRARRLLADNVSLDRAWAEINGNRPTPEATIEALVYSLRRGAAELSKPDKLRRLSELDKAQLKAICRHLQNFNPEIAPPWPPEDVAALIAKWRELHG